MKPRLLLLLPFVLCQCVVVEDGGSTTGSAAAEEVPSTAPVPSNVINDCLAELRKSIPDRPMQVISATRGETSYIVDVQVAGAEKPWRCYHDGTRCTGTMYLGEG